MLRSAPAAGPGGGDGGEVAARWRHVRLLREAEPGVARRRGEAAGAHRLGDRGVDHRGAQGLLDLLADVVADGVAELAGERSRLPPDGGEQLLALPAEGADLVAGQAALGRTERLAQLEQLLDLRRRARGPGR